MTKKRFTPGLKLMIIGGMVMTMGLAGIIATPRVPGSADNPAVLLALLLILVGGAGVCLTGSVKRIIYLFRTTGFLGIKIEQ
ncbi:hypothetical protein [Arthrobacter psychrolactophilus]